MTTLQEKRVGEILRHYGEQAQRRQLVEECAELIQAVTKYERTGRPSAWYNFIEEMADVEIMLEQMRQTLTENERDTLQRITNAKINRQLTRIARGE